MAAYYIKHVKIPEQLFGLDGTLCSIYVASKGKGYKQWNSADDDINYKYVHYDKLVYFYSIFCCRKKFQDVKNSLVYSFN